MTPLRRSTKLRPDWASAGVVVLHGADAGDRTYFLYEHLADLLERERIAVLRNDRRPSSDGHDVPLAVQAADALAVLRVLSEMVDRVPDTAAISPCTARR